MKVKIDEKIKMRKWTLFILCCDFILKNVFFYRKISKKKIPSSEYLPFRPYFLFLEKYSVFP